jgi:Right handed beta helix region
VAAGAERAAIRIALLQGFAPSGVWIEDNHIETPGDGISITNPGSHFTIRGNRIFGSGNFTGILVGATSATVGVHRDFKISGNTLANFTDAGIQLSTFRTSERFDGVTIDGNEIYIDGEAGGAAGIRLRKPGSGTTRWLVRALLAENRISENIQLPIDRHTQTVPFIAVAGNPGSRAVFEGDGSPEGVVPAPFGSLFVR